MSNRYTQVVVLCEDFMHFNFVRRFLIGCGIDSRRIRGEVNPKGRGAETKYVVDHYPAEVKALRSKPHIRTGLIAIIDADTTAVSDRLRQLEQSLCENGQPKRGPEERIGLLSPKRNVETWVHFLCGNPADETTDFKTKVKHSDIPPAVAAFSEKCPQKCGEIPLPSLQAACRELDRFIRQGGE
jgi:hypothetical protein